jgi:OmpA-OmpF porin, OOP family
MMQHARWWARRLATGIAIVLPMTAGAQERGAIELGVFGRATRFDESNRLESQVGIGGMLAVLVGQHLALELTASYSSGTDTDQGTRDVSYLPASLLLVKRDSLSPRTDLVYGIGTVRNQFGGDYDTHEWGGTAIVGARRLLTQWIALRGEGVMDFMSSPSNGSPADLNFALQIGASIQLNRVPPPDRDFDGVPDRLDRCPGTPGNTDVDRDGCTLPPDADLDGIPDGEDRCPDTGLGVSVDRYGCPRFREAPPPA